MERLPEDLQIYIYEMAHKLKMKDVFKDIQGRNKPYDGSPYDSLYENDDKIHYILWNNDEYLEEHKIFLLSNWAISVELWRPHIYTDKKYVIYRDYSLDDNFNIIDRKFLKEPIEGNTWLDLYFAANKLIAKSGDNHIFIESFDEDDNESIIIHLGS